MFPPFHFQFAVNVLQFFAIFKDKAMLVLLRQNCKISEFLSQNPPLYYQFLIVQLLDGDHHLFLHTLAQLEIVFISVLGNWTVGCRKRKREKSKKDNHTSILVSHNRNQIRQRFTSFKE